MAREARETFKIGGVLRSVVILVFSGDYDVRLRLALTLNIVTRCTVYVLRSHHLLPFPGLD